METWCDLFCRNWIFYKLFWWNSCFADQHPVTANYSITYQGFRNDQKRLKLKW